MTQSLTRIIVHIVFSTKDHFRFLEDTALRDDMHGYLARIAINRGGYTLQVGGVADHVHALVVLPKNDSIPVLVGELKRSSSAWIKERGGILAKFAWQNGYGAFSIGQSQVARVSAYIRNQAEHHRQVSFMDEFRQFLQKYNVEYDERYVWD